MLLETHDLALLFKLHRTLIFRRELPLRQEGW
jgi:hypothetical protein